MKNKSIFICLVLLISSFVIGCKWQVPESVSVKTNAEYNFGAGNVNKSLDEYLDVRKLVGNSLPANVKVYDYFPGKENADVQRYLMKASLVEIPLDIGSMMDQIDLTSNLKAMEFSKTISIPEVNIPEIKKEVTVSINVPGIGEFNNGTIPGGQALSTELSPVDISLKEILPASSGITECIVKEGSIGISINGLNEDAEYTVKLTSTGGLNVDGNGSGILPIPLENATIKSGEPSTINIKIMLENVKSINRPEIVIKPVIDSVKSVKVNLGEGINTSFNKTVALPTEATSMITAIQLKDSGFDMEYTNTLPASNKIRFSYESNFLGLTREEITLTGTDTKTVISNANVDSSKLNAGVDFNVGLTLPDAVTTTDGKTTAITIKDVAMGKEYKIGFKITPKLDWTSVSVNPSALSSFSKNDQKVDLGLDLNQTMKDLGKNLAGDDTLFTNLELESLPIYIFCGKPQGLTAFNDLKFKAKAELKAGTESLGYLLGSSSGNADIKFANALPDFNVDEVVTDKFTESSASAYVDLGDTFSKIISTPGKLSLTYSVSASGANGTDIKIDKAELEKAGTTKIALEAYIDLGLALTVPNDITVDLSKMGGMKDFIGKDIFQGNGKSMKEQGIDNYFNAIKSLSINCDVNSLPYASAKPITLNIKSSVGDWALNLASKKPLAIGFTDENIKRLFNNNNDNANPNCEFTMSEMKVVIPAGTFSIPRAKSVDTNLYLNLKTDGTIKVWEKNPNSKGGN